MSLTTLGSVLPAATPEAMEKLAMAEERIAQCDQLKVRTEHIFHAGMYVRTVRLAPNTVIVSALIKVPTMIIVNGTCSLLAGDEFVQLSGYNVIPASGGRKQIYVAVSELSITMVFPSHATTVEEAESEFTDEPERLMSRTQEDDMVLFTGI